jgi:light-regulated signal transduction histidine kinase (bacteriophytochrome)
MTTPNDLEAEIVRLRKEIEEKDREIADLCYAISHDLRAPLRVLDGFSQALAEDYGEQLEERGADYIRHVRSASRQLESMIGDVLKLSRVGRADVRTTAVDVSDLARSILESFAYDEPDRHVRVSIEPGVVMNSDRDLLRLALQQILSNAWKFTRQKSPAEITFGRTTIDGAPAFYVRDNGAGFDPAHAAKLFKPFQKEMESASPLSQGSPSAWARK